ncbi:TPA: helix-turn-helix transcriptional regulator [Yersinia enterocolitica]
MPKSFIKIGCDINNNDFFVGCKLSPKELEVILYYIQGVSISGIARILNKNIRTVSSQKIKAMSKLGVRNNLELLRLFSE